MKKQNTWFKMFLFIALTAFLVSCSNDDGNADNNSNEQEEEPTNFLLGTWRISSFTFICDSGISEEVPVEECYSESRYRYELADGSANVFEGVYHYEFYGYDSDDNCVLLDVFTGTWRLSDDIIYTITDGGSYFDYQISDLEENSYQMINDVLEVQAGSPCNGGTGTRYSHYYRIED